MHASNTTYLAVAQRAQLSETFNAQLGNLPPVNRLINKSSEEITSILKQSSPFLANDLAALICEIVLAKDHEAYAKKCTIEAILSCFSPLMCIEAISYITFYHLDDFQNLVSIYTGPQLKDTLLSKVLNFMLGKDESPFEPIVHALIQDDPYAISTGSFRENSLLLDTFFSMIDSRHMPQLVQRIISTIGPRDHLKIAHLLTLLSNESIINVFIDTWLKQVHNDFPGYKHLILSMTVQQQRNRPNFFVSLSCLLNKSEIFNKSEKEFAQEIARIITMLGSTAQQACLLCCASNDLVGAIASRFVTRPGPAVNVVTKALQLKRDFAFRKALMQAFTQKMNNSNFRKFCSRYLALNRKKLLPYLFLAAFNNNPHNRFQAYLAGLKDAQKRTRLLNRMHHADPHELQKIIADLGASCSLSQILDQITFLLPSEYITTTFSSICCSLDSLLSGCEHLNNRIERVPYWQQIPPMLLILGLSDERYKALILKSFYCMSENQSALVISALCANKELESLNTLIATESNPEKIYALMTDDALSAYCEMKVNGFTDKISEFNQRHLGYKKRTSPYLSFTDSSYIQQPSQEEFDYLMKEMIALTNFFNGIETSSCRELCRFLSRKHPTELSTFQSDYLSKFTSIKNIQKSFSSKRYGNILTHLEAIYPALTEPEKKPLPDHFFGMLTVGVQKNFGMTHANPFQVLENAGISNEDDLRTLGYLPEKEDLLHSMRNYILDNVPRESSQKLANTCEDQWNQIYKNPFTVLFPSDIDSFVTRTTILQQPRPLVVAITKRLIDVLYKLNSLETCGVDKQAVEAIDCQLQSNADDAVIRNACKECLKLFMQAYCHHIIPTLGHYLSQKTLPQAWNRLRRQGYPTLESLAAMGLIKSADSLFDINSMVDELFSPAEGHA